MRNRACSLEQPGFTRFSRGVVWPGLAAEIKVTNEPPRDGKRYTGTGAPRDRGGIELSGFLTVGSGGFHARAGGLTNLLAGIYPQICE